MSLNGRKHALITGSSRGIGRGIALKLAEQGTKVAISYRSNDRAVSAAKVHVGKAGRQVSQDAVQMHGGMGMTEELKVGHYFKRLTMIDALFGNVDHHLDRFAGDGPGGGRTA